MNFKAAICPSCGGQLQVPDDRDSVKCMYCGSDIVVREAIQKAAGPDPANYLGLAEFGLNEIYELYKGRPLHAEKDKGTKVLDYCSKVLELDIKNPEAWYLKGMCVGMFFRYDEMRSNFQNAIKYANTNDLKQEYISKIVTAINKIIVDYTFSTSSENSTSWTNIYYRYNPPPHFRGNIDRYVPELEFALTLKPDDITTMKNIVRLYGAYIDQLDDPWNRQKYADEVSFEQEESTEVINTYEEKIRKLDPSYTSPVVIRESEHQGLIATISKIFFE